MQLRPKRARCGSCCRMHVLLPSWHAPRRAHGIEVIDAALAARLRAAATRVSLLSLAAPPTPYAAGVAGSPPAPNNYADTPWTTLVASDP